MSRQNPSVTTTVDGTLDGARKYTVKIILTLRELWGTNTVPDDFVIESEELDTIPGIGVEDGDYVLRYSHDNKDFRLNRRVVGGRLLNR